MLKYKLTNLIYIEGLPVRFHMQIKNNLVKSFISQELIKSGVLWNGSFNLSYSHKLEHIHKVFIAFDEVFNLLSKIDIEKIGVYIHGEPIKKHMNVRSS